MTPRDAATSSSPSEARRRMASRIGVRLTFSLRREQPRACGLQGGSRLTGCRFATADRRSPRGIGSVLRNLNFGCSCCRRAAWLTSVLCQTPSPVCDCVQVVKCLQANLYQKSSRCLLSAARLRHHGDRAELIFDMLDDVRRARARRWACGQTFICAAELRVKGDDCKRV